MLINNRIFEIIAAVHYKNIMCVKQIHRSAWALAQTDLSLCLAHFLVSKQNLTRLVIVFAGHTMHFDGFAIAISIT